MSNTGPAPAYQRFPRVPLYGAGLVLLATVAWVAAVQLGNLSTSYVTTAMPKSERALRFVDQADGSILITDAKDSSVIDVVAPGTNGFLRGALRGLARERKRSGFGSETPFLLTARSDGRLTLDDPTTRRQVDLKSFGATNAFVFEQLLTKRNSVPVETRTINPAVPAGR
jgi:putative photosynthetic complex assembly protein